MRIGVIALIIMISAAQFGHSEEIVNSQEIQALNQLTEQISGYITWMSSRDGDWEIYRMDIDGNVIQKLTDNDVPDRGALISDDGKTIAWHRGQDRRTEVWMMNADGSQKRKLVSGATVGAWRPDGKLVIYKGKDDTQTFIYDPATGNEEKVWPPKNAKIKAKDIHGAKPSPDGKYFVAWASNPRGTWIFSADGKFQNHVHGGCEGSFAPDGSFVYWVMTAGTFGKATLDGKVQDPLYKIGDTEYGHTYFPNLSKDMKYLIFGSCPNDQHDHDTSDYEIFLMKMEQLKPAWNMPLRLTFNPATDRWADIFVHIDETPPTAPIYVEAESTGQQVQLSWTDAQDTETKVKWYKVYRGTQEKSERLVAKVGSARYIDNSTDPKSRYYYRISAVNMAGLEGSKSAPASVKTSDSIPITPSGLYAASAGGNRIRLTWASNPELDIQGYNVYSADRYMKLNSEVITEPEYVDSLVEKGNTYHYQVTAVDNSGYESERSNPVSCSPSERYSDGLLAFYRFDDGKGDVVYDRSGVAPPMNLNIKDANKVSWLKNGNGVKFTGSSMIVSNGNSGKLLENLRSRGKLSIEIWLYPGNLSQTGPARIVSMSSDPLQRNFTVGQSEADLAIRLRTTETSENGSPELDTTKHVLSQRMTHVLTTFDGSIKKIYIDGRLHSETQKLGGDFSKWQDYPLVIGNELTGDRAWLGKIFLVAIYDHSLSADSVLQNYRAGI